MLPLSGEEREGLGSGKCAKTSNWGATGLSPGNLWAPQAATPGPVGFPKPRARGEGWTSGPTPPFSLLPYLAPFLYSLWRQIWGGVTWRSFSVALPRKSCVILGKWIHLSVPYDLTWNNGVPKADDPLASACQRSP